MNDVIDAAAGLATGSRLYQARHARANVVQATQQSHDALLFEPVPALSTAQRLQVAVRVCQAAQAQELAAHYAALAQQHGPAEDSPAQRAALQWAELITTQPRAGDRAALNQLRHAGLGDAAAVALAQLVSFLAYQLRVVAGLKAMAQ